VRISEKMATNLAAIVEKTRQLDERIGEIAQSSHEQSEGIGQLNSAVANMDKITQGNAALAQQSASASEELKAQAEQVRIGVAELMRMARGGETSAFVAAAGVASPVRPMRASASKAKLRPAAEAAAAAPSDIVITPGGGELSFRDHT
jgi:methyl-accepting chemotaxis protein